MREVFVDESSQNGHAHMVIGAIIVPGLCVDRAHMRIMAVLESHAMLGEFKWTKASASKLHVYRELAELHFRLAAEIGIEFHALVIDCAKVDHSRFNNGDVELGFNKFLYQLLYRRVGQRFGETERIVVHLDARTYTRQPDELQQCLNRALSRDFNLTNHAPFARIAFRDSKRSRLLQMADLLSGAVAWHKNNHDARDGASVARTDLANYIARLAGRARLGGDSPRGQEKMSIWNFRLSAR